MSPIHEDATHPHQNPNPKPDPNPNPKPFTRQSPKPAPNLNPSPNPALIHSPLPLLNSTEQLTMGIRPLHGYVEFTPPSLFSFSNNLLQTHYLLLKPKLCFEP